MRTKTVVLMEPYGVRMFVSRGAYVVKQELKMSVRMAGGDRKFDLFVSPCRSREVTYKITKHNA